MTKAEIEKRIIEVKGQIFMNDMIDRWSNEDYNYSIKLHAELRKLERELKEIGG